MKRIIVPCGYMGSGSSAVTALVSEYKNCENSNRTFEYVFLHCPNGLFDLEDKLLIGNNAIRSDEALRSFENQMNKLNFDKFWWVANYNKIIGPNFIKYTRKFIQEITKYNFKGFWYTHEEVNFRMFIKLCLRKPFKFCFKNHYFKPILRYNDGMRVSFITNKEFYEKAASFLDNVINDISNDQENVILDQLLLPFNLSRVDNYFDERLKVIVVERDPRDVFITNKYKWESIHEEVPFPTDVSMFCEFYKNMRNMENISKSQKILRIDFEDLIYKYDETVNRITKFLEFKDEDHIFKKKNFKPEISIKNTQVFRKLEYKEEVKIIERELKDYLYDFKEVMNNDVLKTSISAEIDNY